MKRFYFILIVSLLYLPQTGYPQSKLYDSTTFINDTNFISRSFGSAGYFAQYIDTNKSCELYKLIGESCMVGGCKEYYEEALKRDSNKAHHHYKFNLADFPRTFSCLYLYKNNYCLYAPCDFEFNFRLAFTDSTIDYGYAGGADASIFYLKDFRKIDNTTYRIIDVSPINETDTIVIKYVNRQKGILIWHYDSNDNTGNLMVEGDKVQLFPILAEECADNLALTNEPFDKPDFKRLLNTKQ